MFSRAHFSMSLYSRFLPQLLIVMVFFSYPSNPLHSEYLIANVSTSWTVKMPPTEGMGINSPPMISYVYYPRCINDLCFGFGFYCSENCTSFLLSIFLSNPSSDFGFPQIVWSANRNHLVRENSTLEFTQEGDLILRDADNTFVWSTNTSGRSIVGLKLTQRGNLILYNKYNETIWQSYDHPTDTIVFGQEMVAGKKLISSVSATNWAEGLFSFSVTNDGLFAFVKSSPPLSYYENWINGSVVHITLLNGSLTVNSSKLGQPDTKISVPPALSIPYMRLESDGHLRVYDWEKQWVHGSDILDLQEGGCGYPLVCGMYGICYKGLCGCPRETENDTGHFSPIDDWKLRLGCTRNIPLSCDAHEYHRLIYLEAGTYFHPNITINGTTIENCKQACLKNCSCEAAFFKDDQDGKCYLESNIMSLIRNDQYIEYWYGFLKVQIPPSSPNSSFKNPPTTYSRAINSHGSKLMAMLLYSMATLLGAVLLIKLLSILMWKSNSSEKDDNYLGFLPGIPTKFTYEELKRATKNFSIKLGEGGFGSIYEGTLSNGTKIAVKRLHQYNDNSSFRSELEAIGSIHHVNLVRLKGYCVEKPHNLLVYEYMSNGSLDKWIFRRNEDALLDWETWRTIVLGVARGLAYLHDECGQRILHLDIKPQNILLDDRFNAKVSDFGLSKLIDRNESNVMTAMRGTPGYLAPEWLSYVISDKVDVYSFGIVMLEILCGRRNVDLTQQEERMHLLALLERNAEKDSLCDLIDTGSNDMLLHREEALEMMKLAVWCVQSDFSKRPSMTMVVKVLDGLMDIEPNLSYKFLNAFTSVFKMDCSQGEPSVSARMSSSVLSGPR